MAGWGLRNEQRGHSNLALISRTPSDLPTLCSVFTMAPGGQPAWLSTYKQESPSKRDTGGAAAVWVVLSSQVPPHP